MTAPYTELHCHSAYSFLDGVSQPDELAQRAAELGYEALALTDHNSVSGSMELAQAAPSCGLRAIHGAEVDLIAPGGPSADGTPPVPGVLPPASGSGRADGGGIAVPAGTAGQGEPATRHLTLLVRDARGWRNLCRILTHAHAGTREGSGRERSEPAVDLGTVLDHAEGLVCLTGCATRGVHDEPTVRRLLEVFGPENMRVELQRPYARRDRARNRALEGLARRLGVSCVASGDVHAHDSRRAELQDAFVALRHRTTLDASEPLRRGNHSHVMASPAAMAARFAEHPGAVRESVRLAEELRFELTSELGYSYPYAEDPGAMRRLAELCQARLHERYGPAAAPGGRAVPAAAFAQAAGRLEEELGIIDGLGLGGFFLLHHELLALAREIAREVRGTDRPSALLAPGRGRGSSVSSIVCYLTGLSHIDPIANGLLIGRFLHTGLEHLPDIDLDFPRDIREVLIPRIHERYGADRSALVAAFPTFRARGAIRELGKVLGLPAAEIEHAARAAEHHWGQAGEHGVGIAPRDPSLARSPRWVWLQRLVAEAQRLPRHLSQHSGGMVLATRPLIDCCPVVPAAMEGRQMVQWDKDSCADAGLLKIDLLGLGMLSAVERCVDLIAEARGQVVDLSRIPYDDPETFRSIRRADTVGVFQIESRAQMQSLKRTQPRDLDDLTIQVAIVRPGPIQGGAVNPYIERRQRLREDPGYAIPYPHPSLEPVLAPTLGTVIFQDQVMEVARAFAGFDDREAEGLRRAMSRKRSQEALEGHRERFLAGARAHVGADEPTALAVWEMVSGFAGFGFPKAHGAAFGLLAYQSAWLREHHGPEFLCALLNEQPMGFYAPDSLVHEAEGRGIPLLPVDVNASAADCTVEDGGVRLGLGYVKGAAADDVKALVAERARGGPFRSAGELAARCGAARATLERLAWAGACDGIVEGAAEPEAGQGTGEHSRRRRRLALWQMGIAAPGRPTADGTQLALPLELPSAPRLRSLSRWEKLLADYAATGVTVGDHVMAALRPRLTAHRLATSAQLARLPQGCAVSVAGLVIARQRPGTAGGTMFLLFEDEWGTINLIVPRVVYERHRPLARAEPLLLAHGRLERSAGETVRSLREADAERVPPVLNVVVRELLALEGFIAFEDTPAPARVHRLPRRPSEAAGGDDGADTDDAAALGAGLRAVAPPVQSFAAGRRR
ncbi:MAG TPA: DNA polymerase III subunit alpha [Solirubrobacteraceae bacterium]|nr:DNA polymerase III subunit alpha [Solirubrobacteraceae bacterium]